MENGWYLYKDGAQSGPFNLAQLQEKYRDGSLQPKDMIWKEGMEEWALAETVPDLFSGTGAPPPPVAASTEDGLPKGPNDLKSEINLAGWLIGVIVSPGKTFADIAHRKPVALALGLYAIVSLLFFVSYEVFDATTIFRLDSSLLISALIDLAIGIIGLLVSALLLHAIAKMLGGDGEYWRFFSAYCFVAIAIIFSVPVLLISGMFGLAGLFIATAFLFINAIYLFVLVIIALSSIYGISIGKSILAIILHLIALFLGAFFLALLLGSIAGAFI